MVKNEIWNAVSNASVIAIGGHVNPDGDCIGSCLSMYNYIKKVYPDKKVTVYLENIPEVFKYMAGSDMVATDYVSNDPDLFISLDCSDKERLGQAEQIFDHTPSTINIDHHISNLCFALINHYVAESSATCEVLYELYKPELIDKDIAECLYTGIIHDTGVFKYSNTSCRTMEIAGILMSKGIDHTSIIENTFYEKSYSANRFLGKCLLESRLLYDDRVILCVATKELFDSCGATKEDTDGIVSVLLQTKGVEVSVFVYERGENEYKASLRASKDADMSKVALVFGGGGHKKAAGCTLRGELDKELSKLLKEVGIALL